jgi:hypothetical protein
MKRLLLLVLLLSCIPVLAQTAPKVTKPQPLAKPDCSSKERDVLNLFLMDLGKGRKIPIAIVSEDVGKATTTFEMAAREALNLYPDRFTIRDDAELTFYITGTNPEDERGAQEYNMRITQRITLPVRHNGKMKGYTGNFVFAAAGGTVQGALTYKAQAFKERAFETLGKFLKKIDE